MDLLPGYKVNIHCHFSHLKITIMKKQTRKLVLKKSTVIKLTQNEQEIIAGGATFTCISYKATDPCICRPPQDLTEGCK